VPAVKRHTITSSSKRRRKTLVFVTDDASRPFSSHFSDLIHAFERASRKPTGDELKGISVSAYTFPSFASQFLTSQDWPVPVSEQENGWRICYALSLFTSRSLRRTDSFHSRTASRLRSWKNRCWELRSTESWTACRSDGMSRFSSLIGHQSKQSCISSETSHLRPPKPVKVVSSMGEQSVGKSFTLNHLVDTSFAGSAMRTTGQFSERTLLEYRKLTRS